MAYEDLFSGVQGSGYSPFAGIQGSGQPAQGQTPFVQPEWVTKPQVAAPAPTVSPVDAERQRKEEEEAAMQHRI